MRECLLPGKVIDFVLRTLGCEDGAKIVLVALRKSCRFNGGNVAIPKPRTESAEASGDNIVKDD